MKSLRTKAIVLARTDYGEADRIITFLTPEYGKLRLMARGVRKVKSKLAGGIELFSTSDISFIKGKGDIGTLVSTQLITHYGNIIKDIDRVQLGYDLIKKLNKATEDTAENDYYNLIETIFDSLNEKAISLDVIQVWFNAQLLNLSGHTPNLETDTKGNKLNAEQKYNFDFDSVAFMPHKDGRFNANNIKAMRLLFSQNSPKQLSQVKDIEKHADIAKPIITTLQKTYQHF